MGLQVWAVQAWPVRATVVTGQALDQSTGSPSSAN